jgi:hypothetical protein
VACTGRPTADRLPKISFGELNPRNLSLRSGQDKNGAYNILRKVAPNVPKAFGRVEGVVVHPLRISL